MTKLIITEDQYQSLMNEGKMPISAFYKKHNIDSEELSWMGSGDFGDAYETEDGRVVKITRSSSEYEIAQQLLGKHKKFTSMATIYDVADTAEGYVILQELLDTDGVDDLYGEMDYVLGTQDASPLYMDGFDEDEYEEQYGEMEEELKDFMHGVYLIAWDYRNLGITAPDIHSENMGYSRDGKLKAFDIEDKSRN